MATIFFETPDATQGTQWWTSISGSVTYDSTTARKSGLASWKCDSGAGNAAAYLRKQPLSSGPDRLSFYMRLDSLPASDATVALIGSNSTVGITSGGVLRYYELSTQKGSDGSTLSVGTWYRICIALDLSGQAAKVFLDGVEDISATSLNFTDTTQCYIGWGTYSGPGLPGANEVLNIQHVYIDDDTSVTDTDDMRVTAKLPAAVNNNNYDTTEGTGAVNERPISETNGMMHAAKSAVLQDYTLETAAAGDVDISGGDITLVARCAWMWSVHSKDGDTYFLVDNGDSTTHSWSDQEVATLNYAITDSAVYPSNAAGIGQKSGAASPDDYLYECGTLIAYKVAAVADVSEPAVWIGRSRMTVRNTLLRMFKRLERRKELWAECIRLSSPPWRYLHSKTFLRLWRRLIQRSNSTPSFYLKQPR